MRHAGRAGRDPETRRPASTARSPASTGPRRAGRLRSAARRRRRRRGYRRTSAGPGAERGRDRTRRDRARRRWRRRERPIEKRHVAARRGLEGRIAGKRQEQREAQVKAARLGVAEHAEAQHERQRRGIPQLEQRPGDATSMMALAGSRHGLRPPISASATSCSRSALLAPAVAPFAVMTSPRDLACKRPRAPTPAPRATQPLPAITSASPFPCSISRRPHAAVRRGRSSPSPPASDWRRPGAAS